MGTETRAYTYRLPVDHIEAKTADVLRDLHEYGKLGEFVAVRKRKPGSCEGSQGLSGLSMGQIGIYRLFRYALPPNISIVTRN